MTPGQRYRLELAKDRTPSTSAFVWLVPLFLGACWLCKNTDTGAEVASAFDRQLAVMQVPARQETVLSPDYSKYVNGDPVCQGHWPCILGWHL